MLKKIKFGDGYFVEDNGAIYSLKSGTLKLLKPLTAGYGGYEKVRLYDGGRNKWKAFLVHRLVAEAFIPNPHGYKIVNHKNENRSDNSVNNLEWCTVRYNNTYGNALKKKSETMKSRFLNNSHEVDRMRKQSLERIWRDESKEKISQALSKPIIALSNNAPVAYYQSAKQAQETTGVKRSNICKALKGERKQAGGYCWEYAACGGEIEASISKTEGGT